MRIDRATAESVREHPNVVAFLRVIRERESNQNEDAWTIVNGGAHFTGFARHPYEGLSTLRGGKAAGAYQFIPSTWAEVAQQLGLADFSPPNQTLGAIGRIAYRDALDDVLAGRLEAAVRKCRAEWTSLPGASESSAGWTMAKAAEVFRAYGGKQVGETQPAAPVEDRSTTHQPDKEAKVAPIIIPILSAISTFLPALAKIFNDGSAKGQKIEALAPLLADGIVKVTGSMNLQEAAERVVASPEVAREANKAVEDVVYQLSEVGGGIEAARRHDLAVAANVSTPLLRMPSFIVTLCLLPLVFFVVFMVLAGRGIATVLAVLMTTDKELVDRIALGFAISADMQNVVITAIIAGVLSGITGFFLGTSFGSQRKDVTINNLSQ
jgi:muramidase (phage lysozyme)